MLLYFNDKGIAKLSIGLGKGKRKYDKRETQKKRDWDRQKARLLREKGWIFFIDFSNLSYKNYCTSINEVTQ